MIIFFWYTTLQQKPDTKLLPLSSFYKYKFVFCYRRTDLRSAILAVCSNQRKARPWMLNEGRHCRWCWTSILSYRGIQNVIHLRLNTIVCDFGRHMTVCVCVCVYTRACMIVCVCAYMCAYVCECVCVCVHTCVHTCVSDPMCAWSTHCAYLPLSFCMVQSCMLASLQYLSSASLL